jgi:hypothetical protein
MEREGVGEGLVEMPDQSTAQPTPKRPSHLDWTLLPESCPQFQVPERLTVTEPLALNTATPEDVGSGFAALAKETPTVPARTARTVTAAAATFFVPLEGWRSLLTRLLIAMTMARKATTRRNGLM